MLFSRKPVSLVFVERNGLLLYPKDGSIPLSLPEAVFQYLEIRDAAKLTELLTGFAAQGRMRGKRFIVMLSKDVVFQKAITLGAAVDTEASKKDFEDKVPLAPEDRQVISMQQKDRLFLFGANKTFYQAIVSALEGAGAKVTAVIPAVVYGLTESDKLSNAKLAQIANTPKLMKAANFLINS